MVDNIFPSDKQFRGTVYERLHREFTDVNMQLDINGKTELDRLLWNLSGQVDFIYQSTIKLDENPGTILTEVRSKIEKEFS